MKKMFLCSLLVFSFLLTANNLKAQKSSSATFNIGVVDVEAVVKEMPEAGVADKMLKDLQKKYSDSLQKMQEDLVKKVEQYQKQRAMMVADKQQKEEEGFRNTQAMLERFREEKFMEINQKRDEYLEPIRAKVRKAIQEVAKEEGMSFALDKGSSAVLFAEDKFDITFKVIDRIKRGAK